MRLAEVINHSHFNMKRIILDLQQRLVERGVEVFQVDKHELEKLERYDWRDDDMIELHIKAFMRAVPLTIQDQKFTSIKLETTKKGKELMVHFIAEDEDDNHNDPDHVELPLFSASMPYGQYDSESAVSYIVENVLKVLKK